MDFNEEYYRKTIEQYHYSSLDFAPMDFEFCSIPKEVMRAKWLCHSGLELLGEDKSSFIITTGVGLSGIPHMGTLSQILRAIFLQKNGFIRENPRKKFFHKRRKNHEKKKNTHHRPAPRSNPRNRIRLCSNLRSPPDQRYGLHQRSGIRYDLQQL